MSGGFSAGGLITGLDSNTLIRQLMALERQPITRMREQIARLEGQRTAISTLRERLQTLRSRAQDFRLTNRFDAYRIESSDEAILTAQSADGAPPLGAFSVEVVQLASATVARSGSSISASVNPALALEDSGINQAVTAGVFSVNGVAFTVDPSADSLQDMLDAVNASAAGVTATYDAVTDKVTFENTVPGNTSIINFGAPDDTSNFLQALRVTLATQSTGGGGSTVVSSTGRLGAISTGTKIEDLSFAGGAVTGGSFSINGISIAVDPTQDSITDVVARINSSGANVTAGYDAASDTLRIQSNALGSRTVSFGGSGDTSNFLEIMQLDAAVQTAGKDAQFKIDGGPVETRNTNEINDALAGVTLRLSSVGTSTVNIATDNDAVLETVRGLLTEFNTAAEGLRDMTRQEGQLRGDSSISSIESNLRSLIFSQFEGAGVYKTLVAVGVNTGKDFDAASQMQLQLDEEQFLEALNENRSSVEQLFSNSAGTGIADKLFDYLDDMTRTTGFLNARIRTNGTIDSQIRLINDRVDNMEQRLVVREDRLRRSFTRLEQLSAGFQQQSTAISGLASQMRFF